jgi:hypothetical protein
VLFFNQLKVQGNFVERGSRRFSKAETERREDEDEF